MHSFAWIGFEKVQSVPVVFPMTLWIVPANDGVMISKSKL